MAKVEYLAPRYCFIIALLVGLALRAIPLLEKQYFTGDELRAYLAATAHQGEYRQLLRDEKPPLNTWVTAQAWTRLVHPAPALGLGAVAQDLAWYDVHPPLYFWLLHLWSRLVGVTFWAGALLNLLLEVLILALLIAGGQRWLGTAEEGWWLGAIWWLSPVAIRVSPLTRHYVLLTLLSLLYVCAFNRLFYQGGSRPAKVRAAGLLLLLSLLGLLTHYLFVLVIGTSVVLLLLRWGGHHRQRLFYLLGLLGLTALLFTWVYPDFWAAFTFLQEARPDFWSGFTERLGRSAVVIGALYLPILLGLISLLIAQKVAPITRREHSQMLTPRSLGLPFLFHPLCAFAWLPMLGVVFLYLLLISPHHAMGPQYVNFCTPFVAWLALHLLKTPLVPHPSSLAPRGCPEGAPLAPRSSLLATLLLLVLLNLTLLHPALRNFGFAPRLQSADLATDGVIIFDHPASIHWLNFALHLPADQSVYVASQADLLAHPERWLPRFRTQGGLYLAWTLHNPQKIGATIAQQERILQLVQSDFQVIQHATLLPLDLGELRIYRIIPH